MVVKKLNLNRFLNKLTGIGLLAVVGAPVLRHFGLIDLPTTAQFIFWGLACIAGSDRTAKIAQLLAALGDGTKRVSLVGSTAHIEDRAP